MELTSLIYLFGTVTFGIYVGLALWTKASSTKDFYIIKKSHNSILVGILIAIEWLGAASFLSIAGTISKFGYSGTPYILGFTGGFVLLCILFVPYLRKIEQFTIPDFIEKRYNSSFARLISIIIILIVSFIYISAQIKGLSIVFTRFFEVEINNGLIISIAIIFLYSILTGMKTNNYSQVAQYLIIVFSYTFFAIFLSLSLTNTFIPQFAIFSKINFDFNTLTNILDEGSYFFAALDKILLEYGFKIYEESPNHMNIFMVTLALMLGTAALPNLLIKFFTMSSAKNARKSTLWALIFIAFFFTTISSVAYLSKLSILKNVQYFDYMTNQSENSLNSRIDKQKLLLKTWEETGILFENSQINKQNNSKESFNQFIINQDIIILISPELARLPNWIIAFLISGALAAILTTTSAILLLIYTTISNDLYEKYIYKNNNKNIKNNNTILILIIFTFVISSAFFNIPSYSIVQTVGISFTLIASSIFPAIFLGIYDKRMNKEGIISGILIGFCFTLIYIIYFIVFDNNNKYLLSISPEGIGALGAILNFIVSFIVSRFTKVSPICVQKLINKMRTPMY